MEKEQVIVLEHQQIVQKIKRLSTEILEQNFGAKEIILLGINKTGYKFASLIEHELKRSYDTPVKLLHIKLNPAKPNSEAVEIEDGVQSLKGKIIIIVDDVANTGRTLFYAFKPLMDILPKKVEVAVLVNRKHKSFPVKVDFMGLELATTLKEMIKVDISDDQNYRVFLE